MDQSSVSPNSNKQFTFPIRKRNYKGKPVVPSPQLDYHNESMFSLFKDINDKKTTPTQNQMRSTMEETTVGPFKNTVTESFKSAFQRKPSTQTLTGLT